MQLEGDKTQVYKVRMACGHIEDRRMRPATAGIPWSPEAIIDTPRAECKACRDARMLENVKDIEAKRIELVQHRPFSRNGRWGR